MKRVRSRNHAILPLVGIGFLCTTLSLSAQISLAEALDTPGWTWTTSPENPFGGAPSATARKDGDLAAGIVFPDAWIDFENPGVNWIETTVEGPAVFQIFTRTTGDPYLSASLQVNGLEADHWNFEFDFGPAPNWRALTAAIRPGTHTVRVSGCFGCFSIGTLPVGDPTVEFDQAELRPLDPAIGEAMDAPQNPWYAGGQVAVVTGPEAHDGTDALRSELSAGISWVETVVEGPVTASWWRSGRAQISIDGLAVSRDLDTDWKRDVFFVPPGESIVRWSDDDFGPTGERSTLDQFSTVPAPEVSLQEALDTGAQVLTQGGGGTWRGVETEAAPDREDVAWLEVRTGDDPTWLETVVEGPASLAYQVVVRGDVRLTVTVNGQRIDHGSGYVFGERPGRHESLLPPGTNHIRWEVLQEEIHFIENGILLLDQLQIELLPSASLEEALDDPGLVWTTSGDRPWSGVVSTIASDEEDAVVSPELSEGESSWLETTVTGPGTFSYHWTRGYERFGIRKWEFLVDGQSLTWDKDFSNDIDNWRYLTLGPGEHTLRWELQGEVVGSVLVLDQARWSPTNRPPFSEALDLPPSNIHWQSPNWSLVLDEGRVGGDALRFGPVGTFTHLEQLSLRLQGPAEVSFFARTGLNTSLRYAADGVPGDVITTEGAWERITLQIPPGDRELHLTPGGWTSEPTPENSVWIDEFTILPNAVSIASVLDLAPTLPWSTNPENPWVGVSRPGYPKVVAAGQSFDGELSWLETKVKGPAVITYRAKGKGRDTYPNIPGIRILVDGADYASIYTSLHKSATIYIRPGEHTLRFEAAPGTREVNPEIQRLSVAPMSGEPTLRVVDGFLVLKVPRPLGFTDDRIGMNVAKNLSQLNRVLARRNPAPLHESTPAYLVFRYDVSWHSTPDRLFGAARFDP